MPKAVGAEKYLYSPEDGPEPHDDYVETWLARTVDGPAARALEAARRRPGPLGVEADGVAPDLRRGSQNRRSSGRRLAWSRSFRW